MTINASIVQDAFHYALAAAGGTWRGLESSFAGRGAEYTRGQYLKLAYQAAKSAGLNVDRPKRLADVAELLEFVAARCTHQGIDPFTGEKLCTGCKVIGRGDLDAGLCWDCRAVKRNAELGAIAAERASLEAATAALDARIATISGAAKHTGCCFVAGRHGSNGGGSSPCWCGHGDRPVEAQPCATDEDGIDAIEDRAHARAMRECLGHDSEADPERSGGYPSTVYCNGPCRA